LGECFEEKTNRMEHQMSGSLSSPRGSRHRHAQKKGGHVRLSNRLSEEGSEKNTTEEEKRRYVCGGAVQVSFGRVEEDGDEWAQKKPGTLPHTSGWESGGEIPDRNLRPNHLKIWTGGHPSSWGAWPLVLEMGAKGGGPS